MKYKFEQFKVEIVDPTIEINYSNINVNYLTKTISVDVKLIDSCGSKYGIHLEGMSSNSESWDTVDLESVVLNELLKYKVNG